MTGALRGLRRVAVVTCVVGLLSAGSGPALADHLESQVGPGEPTRDFPADFVRYLPEDSQSVATTTTPAWTDPRVGGWGFGPEPCERDRNKVTPVIFVHGNTESASFWRANESGDGSITNVRQRFIDAGYCARDLWAISYTGANGYFTYNDVNVPDIYGFLNGVHKYYGAGKIDIVAHSLGVTVVRKAMFEHRDFQAHIRRFVAVAGGNHGTSSCRVPEGTSHGCDELAPGSAWLAELNAYGETPHGPEYLTIYEGSGLVDGNFLGPDAASPRLAGACNHVMPLVAHNTLARGAEAVAKIITFLRDGALPTCS